jgi:hypothetical protein
MVQGESTRTGAPAVPASGSGGVSSGAHVMNVTLAIAMPFSLNGWPSMRSRRRPTSSTSVSRYKLDLKAKFVTGFSLWVKGQAQGLVATGCFQAMGHVDSTCTAPHFGVAAAVRVGLHARDLNLGSQRQHLAAGRRLTEHGELIPDSS